MEVIFLLAGLVFIAVGVGIVLAELHERRGMQPTRARVIGFSTGRSKPNGPSFYSVAQYAGPDGCNYYVEGVVGSSVPLHNVGDEVTVLVNPAQPGKAALKSSTSFALGSFLALMGLAGTLVFWLTFRATWYSLIAAAVIAAGFAMQIKKAWRE